VIQDLWPTNHDGENRKIKEEESAMFSSTVMSVKAARIFQFSAWWTLLASVTIGVLWFFPGANPDSRSIPGVLISLFFGIVGLVGSVTSLLLLVGMLVHLVKVSGFSSFSKVMWLAFFILTLPIGEVIYFFVVYGRSNSRREQPI
jgi:hypothetical protein